MKELSPEMRAEMERHIRGLPTTSAKIRLLAEKGYAKADIARCLDILYQHVRNVLNQPMAIRGAQQSAQSAPEVPGGVHEGAATFAEAARTETIHVIRFPIDPEGRIKLSTDALKFLNASAGGLITGRFSDGELRLMNLEASVRFAQELAAPYIKAGEGNWSDQVIAERRAEATRDAQRGQK
jgi:hypothetical protein